MNVTTIKDPFCRVCHAVKEDGSPPTGWETFRKTDKLFHCSRCQVASYCSPACQKKDWTLHKLICLVPPQLPEISEVYDHIRRETKVWRGENKVRLQGPFSSLIEPCTHREFWRRVANDIFSDGLNYMLAFLGQGEGKLALDLGCGKSRSTLFLLAKNWKVQGVDYSPEILPIVEKHMEHLKVDYLKTQQLTLTCSTVEDFAWTQQYDLVLASSVLPFCDPSKLKSIMENIERCLKPGGHFIGNFFASKYISDDQLDVERELGAWVLPDENSVRTLLLQHGFSKLLCTYGAQHNPKSVIFIGQKKNA